MKTLQGLTSISLLKSIEKDTTDEVVDLRWEQRSTLVHGIEEDLMWEKSALFLFFFFLSTPVALFRNQSPSYITVHSDKG